MKKSLAFLLMFAIHSGVAADKETTAAAAVSKRPLTLPEHFVPDAKPKTRQATLGSSWSAGGPFDETTWAKNSVPVSTGADWSALGNGLGAEAGKSVLMAHAGIEDTFPVQEKDGRTLGEVFIAKGDDTQLQIEIRSKEGLQKFEVRRDKVVSFQMAGSKVELLFPITSVEPKSNAKPATNKVMLILTRTQ